MPYPDLYISSAPPPFLGRLLRFFSAFPRPKWNSNRNLVVTHPILSIMESCDSMAHLKQIQARLTTAGLMSHRFPASRVLAFCALFDPSDMAHAALVFRGISSPNPYIWNTMIRGYNRANFPLSGFSCFRRMVRDRVEMDGRSFVFVLKSCEQLSEASPGEGIHCVACKAGFISHLLVGNGLVRFYATQGPLASARRVFDALSERDVVSWTTMIDGYSESRKPHEALRLFYQMLMTGTQPNDITFIAILSAISQLGELKFGRLMHDNIGRSGIDASINLHNALVDMYGKCGSVADAKEVFDDMPIKDVFSWTSMMSAYAKCGNLDLARQLFDNMPEKNVVTWSSMIAAYSQSNQPKQAVQLFYEMIAAHVKPTDATLVSVLSACAMLGCLDLGRWIYEHYIDGKMIRLSVKLANAFIDMYAKCGDIAEAAKLFDEMPEKDVVSWNTMILAYAVHGYSKEALFLFEHMKNTQLMPDDITFVGVLSACCHGGLVVEGRRHFADMKSIFGIEPKGVHYACLIDLFGKFGLLKEAHELVRGMPVEPDGAAWGALLNACRMQGNVELGKFAGEMLLGLEPGDSGIYVLMANLYATRREWDDVKKVRKMMKERGVKKTPGCSSIELDGKFHDFHVADVSHLQSKEIYATLNNIYTQLKIEGYVPQTKC
ncbi:pentatricopeptide repeat-containing protein At2g22410, mitochondrial-like [Musa acuminata AAA Group]|uniref:pentatricopeptide repeat-containing protein At2g22410, mitochondrial-like n=1 Tax=Musa acuminata AAA Group TaxID=214697 RepID=UPI0031DD10D6